MQPGIAPLAVVVGWPLRCVKSVCKKATRVSSKIANRRCKAHVLQQARGRVSWMCSTCMHSCMRAMCPHGIQKQYEGNVLSWGIRNHMRAMCPHSMWKQASTHINEVIVHTSYVKGACMQAGKARTLLFSHSTHQHAQSYSI